MSFLLIYYESIDLRVVHATWDHEKVRHLKARVNKGVLSDELIKQSAKKGSELYDSVDIVLKVKELELPKGYTFYDKGSHEQNAIRMRWWERMEGHTYDSIAVGNTDGLPDMPVQKNQESFNDSIYEKDERPALFGHYWLWGNPSLNRENICFLDYSVAKGGKLMTYRFDDEEWLTD